MLQKKAIRLVSILLILILAFQLLPSLSPSFEGGDNHAQNSQDYIVISNLNNHFPTLNQENKKPPFHLLTTKTHWLYEYQVYYQNYSAQYFNQKGIIFNIHRKNKHLLSHYFHGSKYKDEYLFI